MSTIDSDNTKENIQKKPYNRNHIKGKGNGKGQDTCYSATYMGQTRGQQRCTISEVAADWHEPMLRAVGI